MTWLVAGGAGQLGLAIGRALDERGISFVPADSSELDITKPLLVNQLVDFLKPEVIINTAAYTNVDGAEGDAERASLVNGNGPGNLALAAKSVGAVFAHVSTDYVFSGIRKVPYLESELIAPASVYGRTKGLGEQNVMDAYSAKSYVFRTAWLYSADRKNFAKTITRKALAGDEASVVNDQSGQPTFAGDVAKRIVDSVLNQIPFGIYHATNSGSASWFDFAGEIYRLAGVDVKLVSAVGSDFYPQVAKRPAYSVLSHQRWVEEGIEPMRDWKIALEEAMPAIISAVKAEG
jgi:dTDP-4-dehydrorhamnose reductase